MDQKKKNKMKRIMKRRYNFVTRPVKRYFTNKQVNMNDRYAHYYDDLAIIPNTILFEVRDGQSFTDSPYAMYRQMVNDARFEDYTFYWVYSDKVVLKEAMSNLPVIKNTQFVKRNSDDYLRLLASVQYLITNSTFQSFYTKKEGQIYINTWHGTPLKTMGFDIPDNPFASQNVLRNFLMADYLISPNAHTTKMYLQSYKLDGLYDGQILESGYPRIDLSFNVPVEEIYAKLQLAGVALDFNRKTILYTPTWKGQNLSNPTLDMEQMIAELSYIRQHVSNEYNFLVKVHPFVYPFVKDREELAGILVPDYYDANEMMAVTDILITDYSSIFFDFLATNKTILFYSWDKDLYSHDRGMYFEESELPGPILSTVEEVVAAIDNLDEVEKAIAPNYMRMKEMMVPYDDGQATERYINAIFFNDISDKITYPAITKDKYRIILFPSTLKDNGITTSAINLLNNIDYDKYDVTVIAQNLRNAVALKNLNKINKNARIIFRFGWPIYTMQEVYIDQLLKNRSVTKELEPLYPKKAYQREVRRLTGCSHFNVSVDFSGYSYYWAKFMVEMDADRKVIYQHNDLYAEAKARYFIDLRGAFSLYKWFDVLLSVSPTTRDVNRAKLSEYADADKFKYCINTIDTSRILDGTPEIEPLDENDLHLKNMKTPVYVFEEGDYAFIPDLTQMERTVTHHVSNDDELLAIMSGYRHGQKYFKLLLNNIYVGWLPATVLTKHGDGLDNEMMDDEVAYNMVVTSYEKEKMNATIMWPAGHHFYAELSDVEQGITKGSLRLFKGLNVDITQVANVEFIKEVTNVGEDEELQNQEQENEMHQYYEFGVNGQTLGWANKEAFTTTGMALPNDEALEQFACQFRSSYEVDKKVTLSNLHIYYTLNQLVHQQPQALADSHTLVQVLWEMTIGDETYYHIVLNNMMQGWVNQAWTKPIERLEECVLEEKELNEDIRFVKEEVPMFDSVDDYAEAQISENLADHHQFVLTEQNYKAVRYTKLAHQVLVSVLVDGKEVLVASQWLEKAPEEGAFTDIHGELIDPINTDHINFVTMGRLSNEKNQAALIRGVAQLLEEHPEYKENFRLYMLGDGPLKNKLLNEIKTTKMEDNVIMLGKKEHPFDIMKQCDCFILPSLYEGQPMVLLEALTLGMQTIASDIPSNRFVLEDGKYGLLIDGTDAEDIAETLYDYLSHDYEFKPFDYVEYNKEAIQNFYDEIKD